MQFSLKSYLYQICFFLSFRNKKHHSNALKQGAEINKKHHSNALKQGAEINLDKINFLQFRKIRRPKGIE